MIDKAVSPRPIAPEEGINDLLARLYREIGISAVAAALQATAFKPSPERKPADSAILTTVEGSDKKELAA